MDQVASIFPSLFSLVVANVFLLALFAGLGFYALYRKGDVKLTVSGKPLNLTLECREKRVEKNRRRRVSDLRTKIPGK